MYSWTFEKEFKRYLSFKSAIIISVLATYGVFIYLLVQGKVGGGTSIIAFNILLFMVLGLLVDYTALRAKKAEKIEKFRQGRTVGFIIIMNSWIRQAVTKEDAAERLYKIAVGVYPILILAGSIMLASYIIPNPSAPYHMAGGFLLLLYLIVVNRNRIAI